jgi:hypothetical protein
MQRPKRKEIALRDCDYQWAILTRGLMTRKHYVKEYKEALDARAALDSFSPDHLAPPENQAVERGRAEH